jgi:DNA helicase-2/ATP-dependent DNA helicase PcrA
VDKIFADLNPAQKEAVETLEGPLLILAGAGSGKTKTLTHRIANLLTHGVSPYEILAVTFTNKAAREMRDRLYKLTVKVGVSQSQVVRSYDEERGSDPATAGVATVPATRHADTIIPRDFMPWMGTFHSICVRILRIEHEAANIDRNFVIYDTEDQTSLIKHVMKNLRLDDKSSLKPKSIQSIISKHKNAGETPEDYEASALYPNQKQISKIFAAYEKQKRAANALDFDDLLLEATRLFYDYPEVRRKWQDRFRHILIDEYQDTNTIQYRLIKALVNKDKNICVVGDDWQSIYSWRGADFTNILNFERDFPGAKVIKLEQNYRSTGNILDASQAIITKNKVRTDKILYTKAGKGNDITIEALADEQAEANWVAQKINYMATERSFSDFVVLYRTNAQSYAFEKAFIASRIPYKIIGGVRFYDRKEIKDILAYLKLLVNPHDTVSLARITNVPTRGLGNTSTAKIINGNIDGLTPRAKSAYTKLQSLLGKFRDNLTTTPPSELISNLINTLDFKNYLKDGTPQGEDRIDNLAVLIGNAASYDSLEDFLADASLMSSADESSSANSVTLMTLHAAKGLEFPVVFIVGMEEGLFPSSRSETEANLEEERRLAYVGITRAMHDLFLSFAYSRFNFGGRNYSTPSRFLSDLDYDPHSNNLFSDNSDDFLADAFPDDDLPVYE